MSATTPDIDPHPAAEVYAETLASARLTALRALLEIVNTTQDESEKRRAAVAILRAPDPNAPPPRRMPSHSVAAPRPSRAHRHSAPGSSPSPTLLPYLGPAPNTTAHHFPPDITRLIEQAHDCLTNIDFSDPVADITDLSPPPSPAAILAASAGIAPPPLRHNGAP